MVHRLVDTTCYCLKSPAGLARVLDAPFFSLHFANKVLRLQFFSRQMVGFTGAASALIEPSVVYLKIRAWSAPAVLVSMVAQVMHCCCGVFSCSFPPNTNNAIQTVLLVHFKLQPCALSYVPCKYAPTADPDNCKRYTTGRPAGSARLFCAICVGDCPVNPKHCGGSGVDHVLQAGSSWCCMGNRAVTASGHNWPSVDVQLQRPGRSATHLHSCALRTIVSCCADYLNTCLHC